MLASLVVIAALAAYYNSFSGPFVFDGESAVVRNPTIRQLWPLTGPLMPPLDGSPVSGRPLANLSLALNFAAGGLQVEGYHWLNLAIHVSAGLLLFGIVRRTLRRDEKAPTNPSSGITTPASFVAAVLWVVHPLQTESVTYVAQRAESLMGLFYFLTLYGFIRGTGTVSRGRRLWLALSIFAGFLGMASKEVMVSVPVAVLLYDRTFLADSFRDAWRRRWRYYLAIGSSWILLAALMLRTGNRGGTVGFHSSISWTEYAFNQGPAILHYLRLFIWPTPLVIDYGPNWSWSCSARWVGCIATGMLVLVSAYGLRRRSPFGFLGAWFFLILAPTSSVIPVATEIVAEHRMYLSLAALTVLVAVGLQRYARNLAAALALLLVSGLVVATARRNDDYRSELALWRNTIASVPGNAGAHNNLGKALAAANELPEAAHEFEVALKLSPLLAGAQNNLGLVMLRSGKTEEAIRCYREALQIHPNLDYVHANLARALIEAGRPAEAAAEFREALRLTPAGSAVRNELGLALEKTGDTAAAMAEFREVLRLNPDSSDAHFNLGNSLAQNAHYPEAIAEYEAVLRLEPAHVAAETNLGSALLQSGQPAAAIRHFETALRLNPASIEARMNLGNALVGIGKAEEAIGCYEAVLLTQPDYGVAHYNLAIVLRSLGRTKEASVHFAEAKRLGIAR